MLKNLELLEKWQDTAQTAKTGPTEGDEDGPDAVEDNESLPNDEESIITDTVDEASLNVESSVESTTQSVPADIIEELFSIKEESDNNCPRPSASDAESKTQDEATNQPGGKAA
jgi:hypothetical protein